MRERLEELGELLRALALACDVSEAKELADAFDRRRDCGWNSFQRLCEDRNQTEYKATDIPDFKSLGYGCYSTIRELSMLHTLRPCRECGGEMLYKSNYQISCCSCFGSHEDCEDCQAGGCQSFVENANLPDAITAWNMIYGDAGERGRVKVLG